MNCSFWYLKKKKKNCSVSLDPDEDKRDTTIFDGFKHYLLNDMTDEQCTHFLTVTLRNLAKRAQSLKSLRPPRGLSFSLQQQGIVFFFFSSKTNDFQFGYYCCCCCSRQS